MVLISFLCRSRGSRDWGWTSATRPPRARDPTVENQQGAAEGPGSGGGRQALSHHPRLRAPTAPGPSPAPAGDLIASWAVNITQTLTTPKLSSSPGPSPELSPHSPRDTPAQMSPGPRQRWPLLPHPHLGDGRPMPAAQGRRREPCPPSPPSCQIQYERQPCSTRSPHPTLLGPGPPPHCTSLYRTRSSRRDLLWKSDPAFAPLGTKPPRSVGCGPLHPPGPPGLTQPPASPSETCLAPCPHSLPRPRSPSWGKGGCRVPRDGLQALAVPRGKCGCGGRTHGGRLGGQRRHISAWGPVVSGAASGCQPPHEGHQVVTDTVKP